jgi:hypothetical protein
MTKLFFPSTPLLSTVHPDEDVACRARDALSGALLAALQPMRRHVHDCQPPVVPLITPYQPHHKHILAVKHVRAYSATAAGNFIEMPRAAIWRSTRSTNHCWHSVWTPTLRLCLVPRAG